jgi:hypothetical protein
MIRLRCLDCQDGRDCRHSGYVPTGTILAARLFSRALVEAAVVIIMATIMASRPPTTAIGRPRGRRAGGVGIGASAILSG